MRRTSLRRVSPKRAQRSGRPGKLGIVRLFGPDWERERQAAFERDDYRCQWEIKRGIKCNKPVALHGENAGHAAHVRTRRNNGDLKSNLRTLCAEHHYEEHNPKSVPSKN